MDRTDLVAAPEALALDLVGGVHHAVTVSDACSKELLRRLVEATDATEAVRTVGYSPKLARECREIAGRLQALAAPIEPENVIAGLFPLVALYMNDFEVDSRTAAEWEVFWAEYVKTLRDMPAEALQAAVNAYKQRDTKKFPAPGQLYTLAKPFAEKARMVAYRAKRVAEEGRALAPPPPKRMTRDEMIAAGFRNPDGSINLAPPKSPPPPADAAEDEEAIG